MDYLVLYSSVFVFLNENNVLLYDSKSSKLLKYSDSSILTIFNSRVSKGLNVFKVNEYGDLFSLFDDVTNNHMGWIVSNAKNIPFQMAPIVSINNAIYNEKSSPFSKTITETYWDITRLSIYLDGNIQWLSDSLHPIRQTIYCDSQSEISDRIEVHLLENKLEGLNKLIYIQEVNIICSRPNLYSGYNHLLGFICSSLHKHVKIHLVIDAIYLNSNIQYFEELLAAYDNVFIKAIVLENLSKTVIENKCCYIKIVYSERDFDNDGNYQYVPIYNGRNLDFFKKNVFLNEDDICNEPLSMQSIFRRQTLNEFYFGNVTIMFNGDVYNNINNDCIGNIFCHSLLQLLLNNGKSHNWFLTRDKITPCNKCIYCFLCPPISNYEFVINRFNLCNYDVQ